MTGKNSTFKLRWSGPEGTFETTHEYRTGQFGTAVDKAVAAAGEGVALVGLVHHTGQLRKPLRHSGYRLIASKHGRGATAQDDQIILENSEGGHSLWRREDEAHEVIFFMGKGWVFDHKLTPIESMKLRRRWEGIDPDEDAAEGLDDMLPEAEVVAPPEWRDEHGHTIPPELRPSDTRAINLLDPTPEPEPDEVAVGAEALLIAHSLNLTPDQYREQLPELKRRAKQRLMAHQRAMTLDVPALDHDQIQHVPVLVRDGETGEMKVTHTYHDLHAPEGEIVTQRMNELAHERMAAVIAGAAMLGRDTQGMLDAVAAHVQAGQIWDWEDVAKRTKEALREKGYTWNYPADAVEWVMGQEQNNTPQHGWKLAWPFVHLATIPEGLGRAEQNPLVAFCGAPDPEDGTFKWILPVRFIQCGPVPFGPMCPDCVKALEGMDKSDERLLAPEERPGWEEEQDEIVKALTEQALGQKHHPEPRETLFGVVEEGGPELPKFFECGGCGHLHPFGWVGDCRDDSMRYTAQALDERYGGPDEWLLVDEHTGADLAYFPTEEEVAHEEGESRD